MKMFSNSNRILRKYKATITTISKKQKTAKGKKRKKKKMNDEGPSFSQNGKTLFSVFPSTKRKKNTGS